MPVRYLAINPVAAHTDGLIMPEGRQSGANLPRSLPIIGKDGRRVGLP